MALNDIHANFSSGAAPPESKLSLFVYSQRALHPLDIHKMRGLVVTLAPPDSHEIQ